MPILQIENLQVKNKKSTDDLLPKIIKWKGVNIIRQESFFAAVNDIIKWCEVKDVTKIGLVGEEDSGKSAMAESIAHTIHKTSKYEWVVKKFYEEELMNFRETLASLTSANHILIFDDISFLDAKHNKKAIFQVKEAVTKIRHLDGGRNVKIVLIYNYHYTKGLDKYLRQAHFRFFTTIGSEEEDNMEDIVGIRNISLVGTFPKLLQQGVMKGYFPSPQIMKNKMRFFYKYRDPFIPVLFWNNITLRMIISPLRDWLQHTCSICTASEQIKSEVDIKQFWEEFLKKYPKNAVGAVKQILKEQGINAYSKKFQQAKRFLDRALETKIMKIEDIATYAEIKIIKTSLQQRPENLPSLQ